MTRRAPFASAPRISVPALREGWHEGRLPSSLFTSPATSPMTVALPAGYVPADSPAHLGPILARVHDDALRERARQVTFDLRGAGPLGIAGLQYFVGWILEIQDLPTAERYTVHFIGDGADHWQKRGLQALRACAEGAISISFVEGNA